MNSKLSTISIAHAIDILNQKKLVAYPTEAVFGIGCDPDSKMAVNLLLKVKGRPIEKGLILIAANYDQLKPYVDDARLTKKQRDSIFPMWPGPVTFIFPVKRSTPHWLTGCFNSLGIRVTNHPLVGEFCRAFGKPIVSTSANLFGQTPCRTMREVQLQFGEHFPVIEGETGGYENPSEIRDALTDRCFRYA